MIGKKKTKSGVMNGLGRRLKNLTRPPLRSAYKLMCVLSAVLSARRKPCSCSVFFKRSAGNKREEEEEDPGH